MQIIALRASAGWLWVRSGFALLGRQPVALLIITFLNLMLLSVSVLIPLVGAIAPLVLTPLLMVGLMHAMRAADAGQVPGPQLLFAPFRNGSQVWKPLLMLGGFNAVATLAALALAALADGGTLIQLATGALPAEQAGSIDETGLVYAAIVFVLVYTPVQMALWYAPLLVAWHQVPPVKALFFSFVAVLRNKGAFIVYAISWFALAFVVSLGIRLLQAALGEHTFVISLLLSPLSLVLITAVYCSFWLSYRDAVDGALTQPIDR